MSSVKSGHKPFYWLLSYVVILFLLLLLLLLLCQLEHEKVAQTKLDEEEAYVKFPDKETEIRPPR